MVSNTNTLLPPPNPNPNPNPSRSSPFLVHYSAPDSGVLGR
eukprot:gene9986-6969_t